MDNALNQAVKEISQRYDFKNTGASLRWHGEASIEVTANADELTGTSHLPCTHRLTIRPRGRRRAAALRHSVHAEREIPTYHYDIRQ